MADETKVPSQVEFFFELDKDYRIVAANGVWGGITTRGQIHLDFFVEKQAIPDSVVNQVKEDGVIGEIISIRPQKKIVRRMQVGVILSEHEAGNLAEFLKSRLEELQKIKTVK